MHRAPTRARGERGESPPFCAVNFVSVEIMRSYRRGSMALHFRRGEVLRRELVRVNADSANLQGSPTVHFTLPTGTPAAWDMSSAVLMVELELKTSAGDPFEFGNIETDRAMAQEMFSSHLFSTIQTRVNGIDCSDEDGTRRAFPEAIRKFHTRPAGHFASAFRLGTASEAAEARSGAAATVRSLPPEFDAAAGYQAGEFLDAGVDGYIGINYPSVLGVGGPNDTRVDARKAARRRFIARNRIVVAYRPECAMTKLNSLLPCDVHAEMLFEKNPQLEHLLQVQIKDKQIAPGPPPVLIDFPQAGAPQVTWANMYLLVTRVVPRTAASPALYRPVVMQTQRHVYNSMVLPRPVGNSASFSFPSVVTGPRPDAIILCVTADAPVVGSTFQSTAADGSGGAPEAGRTLSLLAAGKGAAIASNKALADRSAPYVTFTSLRCRWGSEGIPAYGPIQQTDADQAAVPMLYEMHKNLAAKLGGAGLSYAEFCGHQMVCFDTSLELNEQTPEDPDVGALSIEMTLGQSAPEGGAPAENVFRLHVVALYSGTNASLALGEHSPSAGGRRDVQRGW